LKNWCGDGVEEGKRMDVWVHVMKKIERTYGMVILLCSTVVCVMCVVVVLLFIRKME